MARFCTECGKEIPDDVAFCTECGTKATADPETPVTMQTVTEEPAVKVETPPVAQPQPQTQQQTYQQPAPQPAYTAPGTTVDPANKVVGTGTYFGLMLLFSIPIIGFIACIIMAFAPKNKNLKNYARAMLIWTIIALVLVGILVALFTVLTNSLMEYINQVTEGQFGDFGDFFSQFSEFGDTMNEFGNMTEQFESGGLSGLPLE